MANKNNFQKIYSSHYADLSVDEERKIFLEVFKPATENFTDAKIISFQQEKIALTQKHCPRHFICDLTDFNFTLSIDVLDWHQKHVVENWNTLNLNKHAMIVGADQKATMSIEVMMDEDKEGQVFKNKYFATYEDALGWVTED